MVIGGKRKEDDENKCLLEILKVFCLFSSTWFILPNVIDMLVYLTTEES